MFEYILINIILSLILVYKYFTKDFNYFTKRGISGPKPIILYGNMWGSWNGRLHEEMLENTKKYGKIFGSFKGMVPCLTVGDPIMLRNIFIKDFASFANRSIFDVETKFSKKVLAFLKGDDWKIVREAVAPSFTTAKIKWMAGHMSIQAEKLTNHFRKISETEKKINLKLHFGTYVADVIGVCACATQTNSIGNKDHPLVINSQSFEIPEGPLIALVFLYETLAKVLVKLSLITPFKYFFELGKYVVDQKISEPNPEKGNELLSTLIHSWEKHKGTNHILGDVEVVSAQISAIFASAFDTTANALSSTLHCLTMNQSLQNKARASVQNALKTHGSWTYEMIQDLNYIDQCVNEGIRLYPPAYTNQRVCEKEIQYGDIKFEKGTLVCIPVYAIHRNPEFYENPDEFIPERFDKSVKGERDPMLLQAFGHGPRSCMGMRFSIMAMKVILGHLLLNFKFTPVAETKDPIPFRAATLGVLLINEVWVGIEPISQN